MTWLKNYAFFILLALVLIFYLGKEWYQKSGLVQGETAPPFAIPGIEEGEIRLTDFRGDLVLLHFWASWCGPCRKQNPQIVDLYKRFHGAEFDEIDGFHIVSIGMENQASSWQKAIEKDSLYWPHHHSELLRMGGEMADLYKVRSIPTKYLIDGRGRILRVDPSVDEVAAVLSEHLAR